jgi:2-oxoglutarate ferredoxin oxidoreductase subunit alpha
MRALKSLGFYINADREFPSLIKGGFACHRIDISDSPVHSISSAADVVWAVDRMGIKGYLHLAKEGALVIHDDDRFEKIPGLPELSRRKKLKMIHIPARSIVARHGGDNRLKNMVTLGLVWRVFGLPLPVLEAEVKKRFAKKKALLKIDLECIRSGYNAEEASSHKPFVLPIPKKIPKTMFVNGNEAIGIGAIHAGVRAYYAYPMSPSSSILSYLAKKAHQTGMVVKQCEDEITVAQMTLGSSFVGTRALCATSGGGLDLMAETLSLSGMTETPLVIVNCQRPGPATGLPTWTCQGDLNMVIHSGHGEFPRIVIGVSDPESCFDFIQHAMNLSEQFQTLVIVLSEKTITETERTVPLFQQNTVPIERGIITKKNVLKKLESKDRYRLTKSGISYRWLPGSCPTPYYANSDEHQEDGTITEDAAESKAMMDKRMRKQKAILAALPQPKVYGVTKEADVSIIGWGSTKNVMMDAIPAAKKEGIRVNYLHYDFVWPILEKKAVTFFRNNSHVCLLEGNQTAQFGSLLEAKTGLSFAERFLKYDGRQFFFDEVMIFLRQQAKKSQKKKDELVMKRECLGACECVSQTKGNRCCCEQKI